MVITTQNIITSQGPGFKFTESNNLVKLQDKGVYKEAVKVMKRSSFINRSYTVMNIITVK